MTQDLHSLVRSASNSLESVLETQRASDLRNTAERQSDLQVFLVHVFLCWCLIFYHMFTLQTQCKSMGTFTELMTSELHARDSELAKYFFNEGREKSTGNK